MNLIEALSLLTLMLALAAMPSTSVAGHLITRWRR